ncbi:hypothetical protein K402DRAFT_390480 [Aulographum hederae CBS 113979]|uniref:Secreted protein n=1 Tax=Aulographum hederae CBS 113979 TaxID=1176131 RepID=A0A6G1HAY2_9PEZI|nr:hypothetical protein K402DRAFT_390480 [Aulographum hederae CBS 113979]
MFWPASKLFLSILKSPLIWYLQIFSSKTRALCNCPHARINEANGLHLQRSCTAVRTTLMWDDVHMAAFFAIQVR